MMIDSGVGGRFDFKFLACLSIKKANPKYQNKKRD